MYRAVPLPAPIGQTVIISAGAGLSSSRLLVMVHLKSYEDGNHHVLEPGGTMDIL